ncbi:MULTISPECIES: PsiF family protein [Stenotrophomonas]|uniref:PsiF family protein n=1 Tax=Stenotrophomonas sp. 17(2023) TaxID=3051123 RepID=UPI001CF2C0A8|nr:MULTISPECIES: PsiF family protein [Stenotrophomonas]MCA7024674.1 PsiF family protein [Stenotrophomonas acidaminiphila]MCE4076752.1 PsiF family protein [Stenotrophomonas acidaminiphila]
MYRPVLLACLLLAATASLSAIAGTPTPQQQRMAECSARNKGLKGDAYKDAQRTCLSGHPAATAATTPQQRMTRCNADAATRQLSGDARKTFMSNCLRSH